RLWDVAARKEKAVSAVHPGGRVSADFLTDGQTLALRHRFAGPPARPLSVARTRESTAFTLWRVGGGRAAVPAGRTECRPGTAVLSPDGKMLVQVEPGDDGRIRLLDVASGNELRRFGKLRGSFCTFPGMLAPDGKVLAAVSVSA